MMKLQIDSTKKAASLNVRVTGYEKKLGADVSSGKTLGTFSFSSNGLDDQECSLQILTQ